MINKWTIGGLCGLVLVVVVCGVRGCGCRAVDPTQATMTAEAEQLAAALEREKKQEEEDARLAPERAAAAAAAKREAESKPPTPPPKSPEVKTQSQDDSDGTPSPRSLPSSELPPKPTRPKDVADWKRDDYYSAQRDGDPRLIDAVVHIGRHFVGNENAAELLVRLLGTSADDPFTNAPDDEDTPRKNPATSAKLTEALIAALAANDTPRARQTLEQIVDGSLQIANSQVAVPAVLKMLLSRPDANSEDLLLRILTMPEATASDSLTATAREKMRGTAMAMIASTASEAFRVRLAKAMIASETAQTTYDRLWDCLKEPRPENLAAQLILYQSDRSDQKTLELMEQSFALQSGEAMGRLLGVRLPKRRDPASPKGPVAADPCRVAERMWNADCTAAVQRRLLALDTLEKDAWLVALASTVPNPPVRAALLRTLERHWDQGPKGLELADAGGRMTRDPGFLVLLKMLPHRDAARVPAGKDVARLVTAGDGEDAPADAAASRSNGGLSSSKANKAAAKLEVKRRQEQTAQQWAEFARGEVVALCQRLDAIAKAKQSSAAQVEWSTDDVDLPFKPHPRAQIVAAHQINWPDEIGDRINPVPLLRVRYVRIEQKAQPTKVLAYYRRQLTAANEHAIPNGLWIESLEPAKEQDHARSVDIFLAKANASVPGLLDQQQEVTVEILTVECAAIAARGSQ